MSAKRTHASVTSWPSLSVVWKHAAPADLRWLTPPRLNQHVLGPRRHLEGVTHGGRVINHIVSDSGTVQSKTKRRSSRSAEALTFDQPSDPKRSIIQISE